MKRDYDNKNRNYLMVGKMADRKTRDLMVLNLKTEGTPFV